MHNAALAELGLDDWHYQRLPVPPALFAETVLALGQSGFAGANVTIPHKEAALALASEVSAAAREIGAANTLTFEPDGSVRAENTDAPGLIAALGVDPRGLRALVLGAGGSARAVAWALREAGAADVAVWNRTPARATALAGALGLRAVDAPEPADVLVNCTSVGLVEDVEEGPSEAGSTNLAASGLERSASQHRVLNQLGLAFDQLGEYSHVVDLVYRSGPTPLLVAAAEQGCRTVDGLDVLVAQGALSFEIWTGRPAPLEVMRRAAGEQPAPA